MVFIVCYLTLSDQMTAAKPARPGYPRHLPVTPRVCSTDKLNATQSSNAGREHRDMRLRRLN